MVIVSVSFWINWALSKDAQKRGTNVNETNLKNESNKTRKENKNNKEK